ncbi:DNA-3-methyladenine glycosylase I, constitutive [Campylobacter blaseri]|uniref:DNA-3-methyladenine glycosylase I n=1 Tax=Campylobacter blaseri TaxID=2042961 RepID=A0A2P8R0H7_9BACT|nr:DNA-3-methyladenine glycosylase I [Campylobacter blaseri]PSM52003.1 DNA-3-methyladenine glycosylase I [Campylobacter blaseri]PSM53788.1 DNA-3-methyladenine glycosylase I [Campylobacter blaseri]QKF85660.1 DNA-3-methyladenine glycosylase I, constitutive [Campylobacter blaseri]
MEKKCCDWALKSEIEKIYHDNEWGKIVKDDSILFEFIILESFQAGLSWRTILNRREKMREAFDGFNPEILVSYDDNCVEKFMSDDRVIKNRLKLKSLASNAKAFLNIQNEFSSFYNYLWGFVDKKQIINSFSNMKDVPAKTELSDKIAKDMKKRGFKFMGSTTVYAYLQSVGVVNDHLIYCEKR